MTDNQTNAYHVYTAGALKHLKMYWKPLDYQRLHVTNDIYDEFLYRLSLYSTYIFGFTLPYFFYFKLPNKHVFKSLYSAKHELLITSALMGFFIWRLSTRDPRPPELLPEILRYSKNTWVNHWNTVMYISLVPWCVLVAISILKFKQTFLITRKKINYLVTLLSSIGFP